MLSRTGGTFTSNPSINTTYYGAWGGAVTEDPLTGTWVFNNILTISDDFSYDLQFESSNTTFNVIFGEGFSPSPFAAIPTLYYGSKIVYTDNTHKWSNEAYRTITITSKLSEVTGGETLLALLQANATKQ